MGNFKELYWFLMMLIVGRMSCAPLNCNFSSELVQNFIPNLKEYLQKCPENQDTFSKFCNEIHQLVTDISDCNLGKLLKIEKLKDKLINDTRKLPINHTHDICLSFETLMKYIMFASSDQDFIGIQQDSVGVQLTRNKEFCESFCTEYRENCSVLLKLYWAKGVLLRAKNEIYKSENTGDLTSLNRITNKDDKESSDSRPSSNDTPAQNKHVIDDKGNKLVSNAKDVLKTKEKTNITSSKPTATLNLIKKNNSNPTPPPSNENNALPLTKNLPKEPKNQNIDSDKPKEKQILANEAETNPNTNREPKPNPPNSNTVSNSNTKQVDISDKVNDNDADNIDKNFKKDANNIQNDKVTTKLNDQVPADEEPKSLPKPMEESPPDSENSPDLEPEKNDKKYANEEPPPDTVINPELTEEKGDKKQSKETTSDKRVVSGFPEEEDSHFFAYFLTIVVLCIAGYLVFHNKQKIIALIIEGRHERRRRPNGGGYKRLDSKDGSKTTSQVIF